jgi:hypothetical protein
LVPVLALVVGDYLLWSWSLNGNHDVIALVSGLTLPPLAVAFLWLLALSTANLIAANFRRPSARASASRARASAARARRRGRLRRGRPATAAGTAASAAEDQHAATAQARADSRKLAA